MNLAAFFAESSAQPLEQGAAAVALLWFARRARRIFTSEMEMHRTCSRLRLTPRQRAALGCLVAGLLAAATGCGSSRSMYCLPGSNCCANNADCYQSCLAAGCNLMCAQTAHSCNSACGNQCTSACHDTNDCSLSCANDCALDCYSTASCADDCGTNCNYTCTDTTRCDVRVGQDATVLCDQVATCRVQCTAACTVNFHGVDDCSVTCLTGAVQSGQGSGSITCS